MVTFARLTSYLFLLYLATETNVWGFTLGVFVSHVLLKIIRNVLADKIPPHGKAVFITGCDSGKLDLRNHHGHQTNSDTFRCHHCLNKSNLAVTSKFHNEICPSFI